MNVVLDNSVVVDWLLATDDKETAAELVLRHATDLIVPSLFWAELVYSLGKFVRRREISLAVRDRCLSQVKMLSPANDSAAALPGSAFDRALLLADQHGLTFCDSIYLELALRRSAALITFDRQLAKAAQATGVDVIASA